MFHRIDDRLPDIVRSLLGDSRNLNAVLAQYGIDGQKLPQDQYAMLITIRELAAVLEQQRKSADLREAELSRQLKHLLNKVQSMSESTMAELTTLKARIGRLESDRKPYASALTAGAQTGPAPIVPGDGWADGMYRILRSRTEWDAGVSQVLSAVDRLDRSRPPLQLRFFYFDVEPGFWLECPRHGVTRDLLCGPNAGPPIGIALVHQSHSKDRCYLYPTLDGSLDNPDRRLPLSKLFDLNGSGALRTARPAVFEISPVARGQGNPDYDRYAVQLIERGQVDAEKAAADYRSVDARSQPSEADVFSAYHDLMKSPGASTGNADRVAREQFESRFQPLLATRSVIDLKAALKVVEHAASSQEPAPFWVVNVNDRLSIALLTPGAYWIAGGDSSNTTLKRNIRGVFQTNNDPGGGPTLSKPATLRITPGSSSIYEVVEEGRVDFS